MRYHYLNVSRRLNTIQVGLSRKLASRQPVGRDPSLASATHLLGTKPRSDCLGDADAGADGKFSTEPQVEAPERLK